MEKVTILFGMENREHAKEFMTEVAKEIMLRGHRIERVETDYLVICTKYTQTCFFYDKDDQPLNGVKADAIFGMEPYKQNLAVYLKESAPYNVGKGLVDYICEAEDKGASARICNMLKVHNQVTTGNVKWHLRADGGIDLMCCSGRTNSTLPEIENVIFNNPATIVFWKDGTKTVVKAVDEAYDPEKGIAMAIAKKMMGNKREYYHTFLHWLKKA